MNTATRLRGVPWDLWLGCCSIVVYALSLALTVFQLWDGMLLCAFVAIPLLIVADLVLVFRLDFISANRLRLWSLCLVSGCLISLCCGSMGACMNLHLARRVRLAGGVDAVRIWGQEIMDGCAANEPYRQLRDHEILPGVKSQLSSYVTANSEKVVIQCGGGFFHYWVLIHRQSSGPAVISYDFE